MVNYPSIKIMKVTFVSYLFAIISAIVSTFVIFKVSLRFAIVNFILMSYYFSSTT